MSTEAISPDIDLRLAGQEDRSWIECLYLKTIPRFYDDAESYPKLWWENANDDVGFFSVSKEVHVLERDGEKIGFCVLTHKRGGSMKVSPLMLATSRHDMGDAWRAVERYAISPRSAEIVFRHPHCTLASVRITRPAWAPR